MCREFRNKRIRHQVLNGEDEIAINKECIFCKSNCHVNFKGNVVFVLGLNNSLSAQEKYNMKYDENGDYVNDQDFVKYFEYLDQTTNELFPNASVTFAPILSVGQAGWKETIVCQEAFIKMNQLINMRDHLDFHSSEPLDSGLMESDKTHMKDMEGIRFWKRQFSRFN